MPKYIIRMRGNLYRNWDSNLERNINGCKFSDLNISDCPNYTLGNCIFIKENDYEFIIKTEIIANDKKDAKELGKKVCSHACHSFEFYINEKVNLDLDRICIFNLEDGSSERTIPAPFKIDGIQTNGKIIINVYSEKSLDAEQLNAIIQGENISDKTLDEAIFHYIESQNYNLDIKSRGSHLYKSFEEIEKVHKFLNISKELKSFISRTLNKARHIEGKTRIPGDFTQKDYDICRDILKILINRYKDYLDNKYIKFEELNSNFLKSRSAL